MLIFRTGIHKIANRENLFEILEHLQFMYFSLNLQVYIPWHPTRRLEQVEMTSKAMAYMHLSARMAIERQYCHQKEPLRFFSPLTFMEFVHVFRIISAYIVKMELVGFADANFSKYGNYLEMDLDT